MSNKTSRTSYEPKLAILPDFVLTSDKSPPAELCLETSEIWLLLDQYLSGFSEQDRLETLEEILRQYRTQIAHLGSGTPKPDLGSITIEFVASFLWDRLSAAVMRNLAWTPEWLEEEAYDATNNAILEYLQVARNQRISNPLSLLLLISRRRLLDRRRKHRPSWMATRSWDEAPSLIWSATASSGSTAEVDLLLSAQSALEELSKSHPRSAEAFRLWWADGLTSWEIAKRLKVSKRTVTRDLARATHFLQQRLFPQMNRSVEPDSKPEGP